jgi:phosphatidate cytidylyltransferase
VVAFVAVLMFREWVRISDPAAPARAWLPVGLVAALAVLLGAGEQWIVAAAALLAAAAAAAAQRWNRGLRWRAAFGVIYVGAPCLTLIWAREAPVEGFAALIYLFAIVWSADVGAYLCGRLIGGPKLAPRVSPNKTWSGFVGGMILGVAAGAAGLALAGHPAFTGAVVGLLTALAAIGGDLFESVLKRRFGVKDAGQMIPGHGGVLDRVDALMGAVLVYAVLLVHVPAMHSGFFSG